MGILYLVCLRVIKKEKEKNMNERKQIYTLTRMSISFFLICAVKE